MRQRITKYRGVGSVMLVMTLSIVGMAYAQDPGKGATSYAPVEIKEDFASIMARMKDAKPAVQKKHMDLLNERYGRSTVHVASTGLDHCAKQWAMRQERRTPAYTTRWDQVAIVRA